MIDSPYSSNISPQHYSKVKPIILNVSKKILNRESIFRQPTHLHTDQLKKSCKLSEAQILSSQIYTRMVERMVQLEKSMAEENVEHDQNMKIMGKLIEMGKQKAHHLKYEVWEIRNEVMNFEELLAEEINENKQMFQAEWWNHSEDSEGSEEATDSQCNSEDKASACPQSNFCSIKDLIPKSLSEMESQMGLESINSENIVRSLS